MCSRFVRSINPHSNYKINLEVSIFDTSALQSRHLEASRLMFDDYKEEMFSLNVLNVSIRSFFVGQ